MASAATFKFSYHRLRNDFTSIGDSDDENIREKVIGPLRTGHCRLRRFHIRRRLRVKLNRFLRRKARIARAAWINVCQRLKESRSHLGDLFAGNYLFVQVNPTPIKRIAQSKATETAISATNRAAVKSS